MLERPLRNFFFCSVSSRVKNKKGTEKVYSNLCQTSKIEVSETS